MFTTLHYRGNIILHIYVYIYIYIYTAVHRPFCISICVSTLPTQHTTFIYKIYIYKNIYYRYTQGVDKNKWPSLKIWLFWSNFCQRTGNYGKQYVFIMHVVRSAKISSQILILIIGLDITETNPCFRILLPIAHKQAKLSESTLMSQFDSFQLATK